MAVAIHVYDLSGGMARVMSMAIVGKQVDIIPHTGIVVLWPGSTQGTEYFFGGGICATPAGKAMPMPACEVIGIGQTSKTEAELNYFLTKISPRFTAETYDLLSHVRLLPCRSSDFSHMCPARVCFARARLSRVKLRQNCNHFSNEVACFLAGDASDNQVPDRILNIANEALSTPQGQQLRTLIEGMQTSMVDSNNANQFNPLSHVATQSFLSASAAPAAPAPLPSSATGGEGDGESLNLADLRAALLEVDKAEVEARRACLTTVAKLGQNVVDNPSDSKYRKVMRGTTPHATPRHTTHHTQHNTPHHTTPHHTTPHHPAASPTLPLPTPPPHRPISSCLTPFHQPHPNPSLKVKMGNAAFAKKVAGCSGGTELMMALGMSTCASSEA